MFRACCVVVESHSSHSFAIFFVFLSDLLLIFVVFRENSTGFEFKNLRSLCVVSCCVVVEFHSSHSYAYAFANSRPQFSVSFRMADAEAAAALQAQITAAVVAALPASGPPPSGHSTTSTIQV